MSGQMNKQNEVKLREEEIRATEGMQGSVILETPWATND